MNKNFFLICFTFFVLGIVTFLVFRILYVQKLSSAPFIPQNSSFKLKAPSLALSGIVVDPHGDVKKQARNEDKFKPLKSGDEILQGEIVRTEKDGQVEVEFKNFGKIDMGSKSELIFVDLLPSEFLLKQVSGTVSYELKDKTKILSVRILHALFELDSGSGKITINNGEARVDLLGQAKIAMVDLENNTQVVKLNKGQRVLIDDNKRALEVIQ